MWRNGGEWGIEIVHDILNNSSRRRAKATMKKKTPAPRGCRIARVRPATSRQHNGGRIVGVGTNASVARRRTHAPIALVQVLIKKCHSVQR